MKYDNLLHFDISQLTTPVALNLDYSVNLEIKITSFELSRLGIILVLSILKLWNGGLLLIETEG